MTVNFLSLDLPYLRIAYEKSRSSNAKISSLNPPTALNTVRLQNMNAPVGVRFNKGIEILVNFQVARHQNGEETN